MKLYHASPFPELHKTGININCKPTCCKNSISAVYLGSLEYLDSQYFRYCPKNVYYIYETSVDDYRLEYISRVDHYMYRGCIDAQYVEPYGVKVVK